jgi:arginine exporter protein ArgO
VINFFATIKISIDLAGKFNKGILFGLGLTFLSFIFYPLLGFGDYQYQDTTSSAQGAV